MNKLSILSLSLVLIAGLTACSPYYAKKKANYWQRVDARSALYMQGAKAQQSLEQDMASCVVEIEELVRLGAVRKSLPEGEDQGAYDIPEQKTDPYWNVPQRFGHRYVDHSQYHDFDSCMRYKGWRRVSYNDPATIDLSLDTYKKLQNQRLGNTNSSSSVPKTEVISGPHYENVNE